MASQDGVCPVNGSVALSVVAESVALSRCGVLEINQLVGVVFSGLSGLIIDDVTDEGELIRVRARSRKVPVPCPGCALETAYVHGWCERTVADVPVGGRPVVLNVRVRRLACRDWWCPRRISRHTALRALLRIPLPVVATPRVLGVDDFSLRRSRTYATVLIDAETRRRVDVLPDRRSGTLAAWLREHPGVEIVCRDGAAGYADAVHQALPDALQVGDRWHIWHNFAQAVGKEVAVHSGCWATASRVRKLDGGKTTTLARWHQVHDLLDAGVGLLECARRLNLALNTVKRYARIQAPEQMRRAPQYRPTLVDPYREYLRKLRAEDPAIPVLQLLREIRERGYTGSQNLLCRYITQGRVEDDRPALSPRRLARLLLTRPNTLRPDQQELLHKTTSACPEMSQLACLVRAFAQLLVPADGNARRLEEWIHAAEQVNLPHIHSFIRGLHLDQDAVRAALTSKYHNGGTEGVNTKTKLIKRQMYGRAGFRLLRHRILLQ